MGMVLFDQSLFENDNHKNHRNKNQVLCKILLPANPMGLLPHKNFLLTWFRFDGFIILVKFVNCLLILKN